MKIFIVDKQNKNGVFLSVFPADINDHLHNPSHLIWLDCPEPNYEWIRRTFKIKKRVIELCKRTKPPVFCESQRNKFFLKTFFINGKNFPDDTETGQINFILSDRLIITLHSLPADCFDNLNYNSEELTNLFCKGTDTFMAYLLNTITDKNLKVCEMIDNQSKKAEEKLLGDNFPELNKPLAILKKSTLTYKIFCKEQIKVVRKIIKQPPAVIKKVSAKRLLNELDFKTSALYSELARIDRLVEFFIKNCSNQKIYRLVLKQDNYVKKIMYINFSLIFMVIVLFFFKNFPTSKIPLLILASIPFLLAAIYIYRNNKK